MSDFSKAVFLSYASQDAEAAKHICEALRTADVEVWFDQSELVGGDAWDAKIRAQIKSCALFMPVISAATQARREGYFRIEWKLAAQRTHAFADGTPFLLPVVIDTTRDGEALVPEEFRSVQWTRLSGDEASVGFGERVKKILAGEGVQASARETRDAAGAPPTVRPGQSMPRWIRPVLAGVAVVAIVLAVTLKEKFDQVVPPASALPISPVTPEKNAPAQQLAQRTQPRENPRSRPARRTRNPSRC